MGALPACLPACVLWWREACAVGLGACMAAGACLPARLHTPPPPHTHTRTPAEPLLEPVARLVRDCMEGLASGVRLRVPLRVRLAAGPSWGELQPVELGR